MDQRRSFLVSESVARLRQSGVDIASELERILRLRGPHLLALFANPDAWRTKVSAFLSMLGKSRDLALIAPTVKKLGDRHNDYGVAQADFAPFSETVMEVVRLFDPQGQDANVIGAWQSLLAEYQRLMQPVAQALTNRALHSDKPAPVVDASLYEQVGGTAVIEAVHRRFYETVFDDLWLGQFFATKSISSLILKQTRFMAAAFGGPDEYHWDSPAVAHMHMFVTDEQADIREILLRNAIRLEGLAHALEDRWLAVDQAFRPAIVKQSVDECVLRCPGQVAVSAVRPAEYRAPVLVAPGCVLPKQQQVSQPAQPQHQ